MALRQNRKGTPNSATSKSKQRGRTAGEQLTKQLTRFYCRYRFYRISQPRAGATVGGAASALYAYRPRRQRHLCGCGRKQYATSSPRCRRDTSLGHDITNTKRLRKSATRSPPGTLKHMYRVPHHYRIRHCTHCHQSLAELRSSRSAAAPKTISSPPPDEHLQLPPQMRPVQRDHPQSYLRRRPARRLSTRAPSHSSRDVWSSSEPPAARRVATRVSSLSS